MSDERNSRVTAEDVKEVVRRYAEQNCPGWQCAGVSIRVGPLAENKEESLLILPPPEAFSPPPVRSGGIHGPLDC